MLTISKRTNPAIVVPFLLSGPGKIIGLMTKCIQKTGS